jgi:hypothetical protein
MISALYTSTKPITGHAHRPSENAPGMLSSARRLTA